MGAPSGVKLNDGFSTRIAFSGAPTLSLWEKRVKPIGYDGGDGIATETMRSVLMRGRSPHALITATAMTIKAAYHPKVMSTALAQVNQKQIIYLYYPNGDVVSFWGFMNKFEPDEMTEGEQPTASVTITPSNEDNTGAESQPTYTAAASTTTTTS